MNAQILIGVVIAALCGLGLRHGRWLLTSTRKGQRLIDWFGETRALWVLRVLLAAGTALGLLLATDVVRPVQW